MVVEGTELQVAEARLDSRHPATGRHQECRLKATDLQWECHLKAMLARRRACVDLLQSHNRRLVRYNEFNSIFNIFCCKKKFYTPRKYFNVALTF